MQSAKRHIDMAALYIGIEGSLEREFVAALAAAARDATRPELRLRILLDAARATRPCKDGHGKLSI